MMGTAHTTDNPGLYVMREQNNKQGGMRVMELVFIIELNRAAIGCTMLAGVGNPPVLPWPLNG